MEFISFHKILREYLKLSQFQANGHQNQLQKRANFRLRPNTLHAIDVHDHGHNTTVQRFSRIFRYLQHLQRGGRHQHDHAVPVRQRLTFGAPEVHLGQQEDQGNVAF